MLKPFFATHREFEAHLQDCYDYSALGEDDFKIFLLTTKAFQIGPLFEAHLQDCYDYSALGEDDFKIFLLITKAFQQGF